MIEEMQSINKVYAKTDHRKFFLVFFLLRMIDEFLDCSHQIKVVLL